MNHTNSNKNIQKQRVQQRQIDTPAGVLSYTWTVKPVKNINLRVRPDGQVMVSAGRGISAAQMDAFIAEKADWIRRAQRKLAARYPLGAQEETVWLLGTPLTVKPMPDPAIIARRVYQEGEVLWISPAVDRGEAVRQFLEEQGRPVFEQVLERMWRLVEPLGVAYPVMTTRWAKTRWGSCTAARGRISINKALICVPMPCIESVMLHELVHFLHPDHSPAFYRQLEGLMPDYRQREAEIRRYSLRELVE